MILYDISYVQLKNNTKEYTCKTETNKQKKEKRFRGFTGGSLIKSLPASAGGVGSILAQDDPLQEEVAPHSSILAWRIPWTAEPGRLQSMGSQRAGHDLATTQIQKTN